MRPIMQDFQEHLATGSKLKAKQAEFEKMVRDQLVLISHMKQLSATLKHLEKAAMYRDMEKDFEDLLKVIIKK